MAKARQKGFIFIFYWKISFIRMLTGLKVITDLQHFMDIIEEIHAWFRISVNEEHLHLLHPKMVLSNFGPPAS